MRFRAGMDSNNPLEIGGTNKSLVFELKELHLDQNGNKKMKTKDFIHNLIKSRGLTESVSITTLKDGRTQLNYNNINNFYRLFGSEKDNMGLFLGTIDGRRQVIQRYSGIESLNLRLSEVMESRGTTKFSITGSRTNRNK